MAVGEGVGDADGSLLQTTAAEADVTLRALLRDEEAEDVLVAVAELDHALLHEEPTLVYGLTMEPTAASGRTQAVRLRLVLDSMTVLDSTAGSRFYDSF